MSDEEKAKALVAKTFPGIAIKDCFRYKDLYLVRVEQQSADEADYDPFLSVDLQTGVVKEFSVITDGDPVEIAEAFNNR